MKSFNPSYKQVQQIFFVGCKTAIDTSDWEVTSNELADKKKRELRTLHRTNLLN